MRELNRQLVLDLLRGESPLSRATLAKRTQLAKPTVSAIVDDLIVHGLVNEIGPGQASSEGGRPPILLEFNANSAYLAGVHVGVRRTTVVVADAKGVALERITFPSMKRRPDKLLALVSQTVLEALARAGGSPERLGAVGICVPGLVDLHRGICLLAPNLGWKDVPVGDIVSAALGVSVYVHNTAQACAVAETIDGAARGASDVALLYVGTGVGAGMITDGQLYRGWAGIAGEIGHCRVDDNSVRCACGKTGCLEAVTSGPAIVRAAAAAGVTGPKKLDVHGVLAAAAAGSPEARRVLEGAGQRLGLAASWLINLVNPEVLVIAGALADAGEDLLGPLRHVALEASLPQLAERVSIRPWALGQEAKVRGSVLGAMHQAETYVRVMFRD